VGINLNNIMSTEPKSKKFESVKITFTDLEMSGTTLVKFLEVVKETEPETYTELKKQLIDEFVRYFKDNGIEPCI